MNGKHATDGDATRTQCVDRLQSARADAIEALRQAEHSLNRLACWLGSCPEAVRAAQLSPGEARDQAQSCVSLSWFVGQVMKRIGGLTA